MLALDKLLWEHLPAYGNLPLSMEPLVWGVSMMNFASRLEEIAIWLAFTPMLPRSGQDSCVYVSSLA